MKPDERREETPRRTRPSKPTPTGTGGGARDRPGRRVPKPKPAPGVAAAPTAPTLPEPDYDAKFKAQKPQRPQMPMLPTIDREPERPDAWLRGAPRAPRPRELAPDVPSPEEVWEDLRERLRESSLPSMVAGAESLFNKIFWGEEVPKNPQSMRIIGQAALNMFWRWGAEAMYQLPKAPERIAYTSGKTGAWVNMPVGGIGTLSPYSAAMLASLASESGESALEIAERGMEQYAATTPEEMRQYIREGEIGYTFMMYPERLGPFREDIAAGMNVREAAYKHQDFWKEFWLNMLIDPAMFLPSEAMTVVWPGGALAAKGLTGVGGKILKGAGWALSKTVGRLPAAKWLVEVSNRTLQRVKAGQASDAVTEIVMRMPEGEDVIVGFNQILRGDTSGFDVLSKNTQKVMGELVEELQDDGIVSLDGLVTRYIPDLADGWSEDVVQQMVRDRPELVPYLVQEATSKRVAAQLGIKPPSERGALARAFDFTSGILKENWLTTTGYAIGNAQDNTVKSLLTDHFINPFDLGADLKVTRYMQDYGSYVPNIVMDGFVADELGLGSMSRTASVPIPGIGKPAEIVDFWGNMFGTNLRAKFPWLEEVAPSRPGDLARAFDLAESPGRLAGILDKANWASVVELGRGFSGSIERSARVQIFWDTCSKLIEDTARPRLVQAAATAGLSEDVVRALGDPSRVKSPRDIQALTDMLTSESQPLRRLSELLPEGSSQEMLGRMAKELDDLQAEAITRGGPEALDTLRTQADELFDKATAYVKRMAEAGEFEDVLSAWRAEKMREVVGDVLDRSRTLGDELLNMTKSQVAANPDRAGTYWARYFDARPDIAQTVQAEVSRVTRERATTLAPDVDAVLARYQEVTAEAGVPDLNYEDWGAFGETLAELRAQVDEPWRAMWGQFLKNPNVDDLDTINLAYDATAGIWNDVASEATVWRDGYLAQMRRRAGPAITREAYEEGMERIWRRGFDQVSEVWTDITTKLGGEVSDVRYVQGLEIYKAGLRTEAEALSGSMIELKPSGKADLTDIAAGGVGIFDPESGRLVVSEGRVSHFELLEELHGRGGTYDWYWYDDQMKTRKAVRLYWDRIADEASKTTKDVLVVDRYTGLAGYEDVATACRKLKDAGVPGDMPVRTNLGNAEGNLVIEDTLDGLLAKAEGGVPERAARFWGIDPETKRLVEVSPLAPNDTDAALFVPEYGEVQFSADPRVGHGDLVPQFDALEGQVGGYAEDVRTVRIASSGSLADAYTVNPDTQTEVGQGLRDTIDALEAMQRAGYREDTVIITEAGYPNNPAPSTIGEVLADLKSLQAAAEVGPTLQRFSKNLDAFEDVADLADWKYGIGVFIPDEGQLAIAGQGVRHEALVEKMTGGDPMDVNFVRLARDERSLMIDVENAGLGQESVPAVIKALQDAGVSDDTMVLIPTRAGGVGTKTLGDWAAEAARMAGKAPEAMAEGLTAAQMRRGDFSMQDVLSRYEQGPTSFVGGRQVQKLPEGWLPSEVDPLRRPGAYWGESYPYWQAPATPRGWQPVEQLPGEVARPTQAPPPSKARLDEWLRKGNINAQQYDEYLMQGQRDAQAGFTRDIGVEFSNRLRDDSQELLDRLGRWRESIYDNLEGAIETRRVEAAEAAQVRETMGVLTRQWAEELQDATIQGALETRRVLFDYTVNQNWEEVLRYFVPFSKWQMRNPIIWAQIMTKKPWVFSAVNDFLRASEQIRQERDLTQRFEGTVPVPQAAQRWLPQLGPGAAAPEGVPQQGYWGVDPRSLFSLSGQFREPFISPGEEELTGWKQTAATAARMPEYLGMHMWPWLEYPLEKAGVFGDRPPWGMLGPVGRVLPAARRVEEQIGEARVPGSSWMRDYNVRRRIAEMQAEGTIDAQTAAQAQFDESHPVYQQAVEEVNRIADFSSAWRTGVPYGLKYASPGEMAIRERREDLRGMPEERAAFLRGQMPATRTYGRAIAATGSEEQAKWMARRDEINARYDAMLKNVAPWHPRATELNQARWAEMEALGAQPEPYTERGYEAVDRDAVLFKLEQQRPTADAFALEDGSIDWEAYNAAETEFIRSIPAVSEELGIPVTAEDYERFRNRYRSPTELAWEMQQERMGAGWDRYGQLRGLRVPERERGVAPAFGQEVGPVLEPSLARSEMLRGVPEEMQPWIDEEVTRRLGAGWESSEVARWLEGQGLPFEAIQNILKGEGYGPQRVGEYAPDILRERPWLKGQELGSEEWGDFGLMRSQMMPGMFTPRTDLEASRDEAVSWFYDLMPSQRDNVRQALRVGEDEEFSDWFDALDTQGQQWAMEHADYLRSVEPLPTEGERLDVELDMLRWSEYGGEWTDLMDKYYGDADSPRSRFWDYWYKNKNYLQEGYRDDDVVQATLSKDVRSFLSADAQDPLYEEALDRLEGFYDPEEAERWQLYPDLVDQADQERTQFYEEFDYDEKPPDGEDRDWWNARTEYQKEHPVMMWFHWYDKYTEWWGDTEPGDARPIRPTAVPTPTPTPMPTPTPRPSKPKGGGGGSGGGGVPPPPVLPDLPGLGSKGWLGEPRRGWLS